MMITVRRLTAAVAVSAAALLLAAGLVACSTGDGSGFPQSDGDFGSSSPSRSARPSPTPSPTPTGVAPEVYQQALADLDAALAPGFAAIGAAMTPADLAGSLSAVAANVEIQRETIDDLRPPEEVATVHEDLNDALASLASDLRTLTDDADSQAICTGSSGLTRAASGSGAHLLRLVATAVATTDPGHIYTVGTFLPAGSPDQNRRPANGNLPGGRRNGNGEITVSTSMDTDAVVKLTEGENGPIVRNVYVQAGTSTTVNGIPDGSFVAYYTTGTDWDGARFTRDCDFSRFDEPLPYTTNYLPTYIEYTTFELTLYSIIGGNASTSGVDPNAFPAG